MKIKNEFPTLKHCILIWFLLLPGGLCAKEYIAYKMEQAPTLDAKAEDAAWRQIPWARGFHTLFDPSHVFAQKQTLFKIGYDDNYLYLFIRCHEPEMEKLKTGERIIDGWPDKLDDIYFIYANTYNDKGTWEDSPYKIMQIGAGDLQRAHVRGEREPMIPPGWETAYRADDRNWYLESAIPLEFLDIDPKKGGWFNMVRHLSSVDTSWKKRTSTWTTTVNAELAQHSLSRLKFSSETGVGNPGATEVSKELGGTDYGYRLGLKLRDIQNKGGEYAEAKINKSNSPNWPDVEKARRKIEAIMTRAPNYRTELGAKADAYLDFLFALAQARETSEPIELKLQTRDAEVNVFVGEREIDPEGNAYQIFLSNGANVLTMSATATGPNPGVKVSMLKYPEANSRWKVTPIATGAWRSDTYDDSSWTVPTSKDDFMWSSQEGDDACFRQVLLWSKNFYGGKLPVLSPPHTQYGFSPRTIEFLRHVIFLEPTGTPIDKYVLQMELPAGFKLDIKRDAPSTSDHWASQNYLPDTDSVRDVEINGEQYQQHTLTYDAKKLPTIFAHKPVTAITSMLPVECERYDKPEATFHFRRLINDNVTGLTSTLPVHMLPPVNGRTMKSIRYRQYDCALAWQRLNSFSNHVLKALVKQGVNAGMDTWFIDNKGTASEKAMRLITDNDGRIEFWVPIAQPLWGAWRGSALQKLIQSDARYAASFFNDSGPRFGNENPEPYYSEFCYTYALGEGRDRFAKAMLEDYLRWKTNLPDSVDTFFFNDENYPWGHTGKQSAHAYCFCDRCKEEFRKFADLSPDKELTDQQIHDIHYEEWEQFWKHNQKGRLVQLTRETLNRAGLKMLYYHNTHDKDAWKEVTSIGKPDFYLVGFPGGSVHIDSSVQSGLDNQALWFHKRGIEAFTGQTRTYFHFHPGIARPNCKNGFALNPKYIKTQLVRMASIIHGGMVYEGVEQLTGGCLYYLGEATRLIAAYEKLFHNGEREDDLADALLADGEVYEYPNILVLTDGNERLVLIFNESKEEMTLTLRNHQLTPGQQAKIFEKTGQIQNSEKMEITIPPEDVLAVHIK